MPGFLFYPEKRKVNSLLSPFFFKLPEYYLIVTTKNKRVTFPLVPYYSEFRIHISVKVISVPVKMVGRNIHQSQLYLL